MGVYNQDFMKSSLFHNMFKGYFKGNFQWFVFIALIQGFACKIDNL